MSYSFCWQTRENAPVGIYRKQEGLRFIAHAVQYYHELSGDIVKAWIERVDGIDVCLIKWLKGDNHAI